jgi:hypothetical protein
MDVDLRSKVQQTKDYRKCGEEFQLLSSASQGKTHGTSKN